MFSDETSELIVVAPTSFSSSFVDGLTEQSAKDAITLLLPLPNGQLAYELNQAVYIITPTSQHEPIETLKISSDYSAAIDFYHLPHPHISIEKYPNCLVGKTRSDVPQYDIFTLSGQNKNLSKYFRQGYAASLSGIEEIANQTQTYIQPVQDILRYQRDIMAVPIKMNIHPWFVNLTKWQQFKLPGPPKTVEGLFEIIDIWDSEYAIQFPSEFLIAERDIFEFSTSILYMLTEQYMRSFADNEEPLDFNTDLYKSLIQRLFAYTDYP